MYFITTNEDEVAIFLVWVLLLREKPAQPPPSKAGSIVKVSPLQNLRSMT